MVVKQASIAGGNEFVINCHDCGRSFRIPAGEVGQSSRIITTFGMKGLYIYQCDCGNRFNVRLDFRRKIRQPCEISSYYTILTATAAAEEREKAWPPPYRERINSVIKNISADGIGLLTHTPHAIKPNDKLLVTLSVRRGGRERALTRRVVVRTVRGNYIGAEFFPADKNDREIRFMLL